MKVEGQCHCGELSIGAEGISARVTALGNSRIDLGGGPSLKRNFSAVAVTFTR
jgi:hypothetical protein